MTKTTESTPKKRKIVALRKRGYGYREIAERVPCDEGYVYRVLREAGLVQKKKKKKRKRRKKTARASRRRNR